MTAKPLRSVPLAPIPAPAPAKSFGDLPYSIFRAHEDAPNMLPIGRRFGELGVVDMKRKRHGWIATVRCHCAMSDIVGEFAVPLVDLVSGSRTHCSREPHRMTYAVAAEGVSRIKIGNALDVIRRGEDLQIACPVRLVLIATCEENIERELHALLVRHRTHGEWFFDNEEVRSAIADRMTPATHDFLADIPIGKFRRAAKSTRTQ